MSELGFKTARELQIELGKRVRELRLFRNLDQRTTAEKAGISKATYRNLEAGHGSSVETLLRTLKALDYLQGIEILVPQATVNPLALLGKSKSPQRVRRPRGPRKLRA
jgi:transcriptional regulator with XRE-family HTH domain